MSYIYSLEDLTDFLNSTRCEYRENRRKGEIEFKKCPICGGSRNDCWNSGININTGMFHCFRGSCPSPNLNFFQFCRELNYTIPGMRRAKFYKPKDELGQPIYLDDLRARAKQSNKLQNYLASRKISMETVEKYGIANAKTDSNRMIIPFVDENGVYWFSKLRYIGTPPEGVPKEITFVPKSKSESEKQRPIPFGMAQCEPNKSNVLIVTEGQMDTLAVAECGFKNVISVPFGKNSRSWLLECGKWVRQNYKKIIVFGDFENGEISLFDNVKAYFDDLFVTHIDYPDYLGCKDANDILINYGKDDVKRAINNAIAKKVNGVKSLSDYETTDFTKLDKIPTGFKGLDEMIGGLILGRLYVLVGKRGAGKSTLANQILANALKMSNESILVYSGELDGGTFKDWFLRALSNFDSSDVEAVTDEYYGKSYRLKEASEKRLISEYGDRITIYDNLANEDVLGTVKAEISCNGERILLIDNLMSLISDIKSDNDVFTTQSKMVTQLAKFAHSAGVAIVLVVHPRKNTANDAVDNIAGSADIGNAADFIVEIQRNRGSQNFTGDGAIFIRKNRLNGKEHFNKDDIGISVKFNERTKQICPTNFEESIVKVKAQSCGGLLDG